MESNSNEKAARGDGRPGASAPQSMGRGDSTQEAEIPLPKRVEAAWRAPGMGPSVKAVFVYLAFRGMKSYPNVCTIAQHTSLSRATVLRAIRWLKENGWIQVRRTGKASKYLINGSMLCQVDTSSKYQRVSGGRSGDASEVAACDMDPDPKGTSNEPEPPEPRKAPVQRRRCSVPPTVAAMRPQLQRIEPSLTMDTLSAQKCSFDEALNAHGVHPENQDRLWRTAVENWVRFRIRPSDQIASARRGLHKSARDPAALLVHRLQNFNPNPHAPK